MDNGKSAGDLQDGALNDSPVEGRSATVVIENVIEETGDTVGCINAFLQIIVPGKKDDQS